jgi:spore germination protein GerM
VPFGGEMTLKSKRSLAAISALVALSLLVLLYVASVRNRRVAEERRHAIPSEALDTVKKTSIVVTEGKARVFHYLPNKHVAARLNYEPDPRALLPAEREIAFSENLIFDTIKSLIESELSEEEKQAGFWTSFPGESFQLLRAELQGDTLTLYFDDPLYFTSGGSNRVGFMWLQVQMTALQFPEVQNVRYEPKTLFQP